MTAPAEAAGRYAPGGLAARRFPLLPRPKPPCRPLTQRLDRVARLAGQAQAGGGDALLHAAGACNLAALIASDCAMPGLARDLCWHQFNALATAGPYTEETAKIALQPLVNLARLRIRDNDDSGYHILQSLHDAARSPRKHAVVDGRAIDVTALIAPDTRATITEWLWAVLLTDGLRALCKAGRWTDAAEQARQHDAIGNRLLGGRQAQILALAASGLTREASQVLQQTSATEPWEHAVTACLQALIQDPAGQAPSPACAEMTSAYLSLDDPDHPMFTACLGLAVTELTASGPGRPTVISEITRIAAQSQDSYIAREILASPAAPSASPKALACLRDMVLDSSLGQPLAAEQSRLLSESVRSSAAVLADGMATRPSSPGP